MRRDEILLILAVLLIFGSLAYAIISTAAAHAAEPEPVVVPWSPPDIQDCDLELWDRIRYLCPKETGNE